MSWRGGSSMPSELVAGALVHWPSAPGSPPGVMPEVAGPRMRVRFEGEPQSKIFSARSGALERIELTGMVRRVSTGSIGLLHAQTTTLPPRWQVIVDGKLMT